MMRLKIITPDDTLFEGNITSLNIAERTGGFTILKGHAPLISVVKDFVSTIKTEAGDLTYIACGSGTVKVLDDEIALIIDYGALGSSKEDAKANFEHLREAIAKNNDSVGDDTIANLEIELLRRMKELS